MRLLIGTLQRDKLSLEFLHQSLGLLNTLRRLLCLLLYRIDEIAKAIQ